MNNTTSLTVNIDIEADISDVDTHRLSEIGRARLQALIESKVDTLVNEVEEAIQEAADTAVAESWHWSGEPLVYDNGDEVADLTLEADVFVHRINR